MDMTTILISVLFGLVGTGFVMFGKSSGQLVPIGAGVALMIFPYFISNIILMLIVGAALMAAPFFMREA